MKYPFINSTRRWVVMLRLCLLFPTDRGAAQYVELTAQIETVSWSDPWSDQGVNAKSWTTRCVVGTNTWLIEADLDSQRDTWLFTGSNLIQQTLITGYPSKHRELYERNHPEQLAALAGSPREYLSPLTAIPPACGAWQT